MRARRPGIPLGSFRYQSVGHFNDSKRRWRIILQVEACTRLNGQQRSGLALLWLNYGSRTFFWCSNGTDDGFSEVKYELAR